MRPQIEAMLAGLVCISVCGCTNTHTSRGNRQEFAPVEPSRTREASTSGASVLPISPREFANFPTATFEKYEIKLVLVALNGQDSSVCFSIRNTSSDPIQVIGSDLYNLSLLIRIPIGDGLTIGLPKSMPVSSATTSADSREPVVLNTLHPGDFKLQVINMAPLIAPADTDARKKGLLLAGLRHMTWNRSGNYATSARGELAARHCLSFQEGEVFVSVDTR